MKMGRRRRCSSVTYRFRYAPLLGVRQPPDRRPILIATKAMLFMGQDTGLLLDEPQLLTVNGQCDRDNQDNSVYCFLGVWVNINED